MGSCECNIPQMMEMSAVVQILSPIRKEKVKGWFTFQECATGKLKSDPPPQSIICQEHTVFHSREHSILHIGNQYSPFLLRGATRTTPHILSNEAYHPHHSGVGVGVMFLLIRYRIEPDPGHPPCYRVRTFYILRLTSLFAALTNI